NCSKASGELSGAPRQRSRMFPEAVECRAIIHGALMVPPLIIENRIDGFSFYESPRALTGRLEEWYASDEDWRAYDSEGRRIELKIEDGSVVPHAAEAQPTHADELRQSLVEWLERKGRDRTEIEGIGLEELLRDAIAVGGVVGEPRPVGGGARRVLRWLRRGR